MQELSLEQMENSIGGKFWGRDCKSETSSNGCWELTTCRNYMFWIGGREYPLEPVQIGPPGCDELAPGS